MAFNSNYKYFNKFFVVGTVTEIINRTKADGTSFGVQLSVNTGSPSGMTRINIPNNKNVPNAYNEAVFAFEVGSRLAIGLGQDWLRYGEREHNGRTYRDFTAFRFPRLATQDETNRAAGKLQGTLLSKTVVDDHYQIVLEVYETNSDGTVSQYNGEDRVSHFTLTAYGDIANTIHTTAEGSNVSCSVRLLNEVRRDDFGDVLDSSNEARVEKFEVLTAASAVPSFTPSFAQPAQAPAFSPATQASTFAPQTTPFTPPTTFIPPSAPPQAPPLPFSGFGS